MLNLEMAVEDGIHRIVDLYKKTNGRCILSFSGGKDSTIVAELYLMARERGLVGEIPIVFADTQVEYQAIYDFVEWFEKHKLNKYNQKITYIKPSKPFGQILKEYGKPMLSKMKSQFLATYQNQEAYKFYSMQAMMMRKPYYLKNEWFDEEEADVFVENPIRNYKDMKDYALFFKFYRFRNKYKSVAELIYGVHAKKQLRFYYTPPVDDVAYKDYVDFSKWKRKKGLVDYPTCEEETANDYTPEGDMMAVYGLRECDTQSSQLVNNKISQQFKKYETYDYIANEGWKDHPEYGQFTKENDLKDSVRLSEASSRGGNLLKGERVSTIKSMSQNFVMRANHYRVSKERLANKFMHFIHPRMNIKASNKCCDFIKKKPFENYYIENDTRGYLTGVRVAEGGARALAYTSCTSVKKLKGKEIINKMPIFDWTDEILEAFIDKYDVKISRAYTEYGLDRTGCIGCPFSKNLEHSLKAMYQYEPKKYKACIKWLGDVYIQQLIKLPFDEEYMKEFNAMQPIIEKRRYDMMRMFREQVAHKWKPKEETQLKLEL